MKIFLIRHGESIMNNGENYKLKLPDNIIYLTENGIEQANNSAKFLYRYIQDNNISIKNARAWVSPYDRTRMTFEQFNKHLNIQDCREDICLVEQQYGLFDSVPEEEWNIKYPNEFEHYMNWKNHKGKFWARFPEGESPFDVALRIKQFFGTIKRDYEKHGIDTLFIFTHGTTLRIFIMQYLHLSPEWFAEERNPKNCWIRFIDDRIDKGYIYNKI